jgi:hypothetical protein
MPVETLNKSTTITGAPEAPVEPVKAPAVPEVVAAIKKGLPDSYGPSFKGNFPEEMRRQMWPLCCGFSILSGFKSVNNLTNQELVDQIEYICTKPRPDFQIYAKENMRPAMTFLTLNGDQMQSKKIMNAIEKCGFKLIGTGRPRGGSQGLFLRDTSGTWKPS